MIFLFLYKPCNIVPSGLIMNIGQVWAYIYIPSYWEVSYGDPLILSYVPNHIRLHTYLQDFRSTKLAVVNSIDSQARTLVDKQCH